MCEEHVRAYIRIEDAADCTPELVRGGILGSDVIVEEDDGIDRIAVEAVAGSVIIVSIAVITGVRALRAVVDFVQYFAKLGVPGQVISRQGDSLDWSITPVSGLPPGAVVVVTAEGEEVVLVNPVESEDSLLTGALEKLLLDSGDS